MFISKSAPASKFRKAYIGFIVALAYTLALYAINFPLTHMSLADALSLATYPVAISILCGLIVSTSVVTVTDVAPLTIVGISVGLIFTYAVHTAKFI